MATKTVKIVDENEEENELILELSIGGIFAKSKKTNQNVSESVEKDLNVESAREIQAHRRLEFRRKREEKLKKSVGFGSCGSVNGPFAENKVWLESEIIRQNDDVLEIEPARKKEKIGNENLPEKMKSSVFRPAVCRNMNLKANEDDVYCDGQCSSHQGVATDDSRSNSSNYQLDQQPATTSTASDPFDTSDQPTGSSKQTVSTTKLTNSATKLTDSTATVPSLVKPKDQTNPHESNVVTNPPSMLDTSSQQQEASFLARMPCVSTTGNGPNGKTVSGFLYRYTKNEVSIVCVCHGQSFSPAGFVEHAGGVDIAHPLKHITIFPTAFAS